MSTSIQKLSFFGVLTLLVALFLSNAKPGWLSISDNSRDPFNDPNKNAPLNKELAYYRLNGSNGPSQLLTHTFVPVSCGAVLSVHHTDPDVFNDGGSSARPILLLNHGYPESSYIWRKLTARLSKRVPLVVPDRPGYGLSTVCSNGTDQRTTAGAILEATAKIYGHGNTVILAGHDRGARAMHRAAVDIGQGGFPMVKAAGVFLADIVPIITEYDSFSNPLLATGYFHWAFLPRTQLDFSLNVIMSYGGGNWVDYINQAGAGINESAIALFKADKAFETYHTFYDQLSVTNASVWDYWNGGNTDYRDMQADQAEGRKIKMPMHVEYSVYNLEQMSGFNVKKVWDEYVEPSAGLTTEGIGGGRGHFIVELAPDETVEQLDRFMDRLGVEPSLF